jgi:hypothetical protein
MKNFKEKELVILVPEFNDRNFNRIYKVLKVEDNKLTVSKFFEKHNVTGVRSEVDDTESIGTFEDIYFDKYL